jgi:hypothetical protein
MAKGHLIFGEIGQTFEDDLQGAAAFASPGHIHKQGGKYARMLCEGVGQGTPFVHPFAHLGDDFLQSRVGHLFDDSGERFHEWQPGTEQRRQLPHHNGDLLQFHASQEAQDVELSLIALGIGLLTQLNGKDAIAPQLETSGP